MRIIAILWTVYLVGVCNCGDDTNVTKDVLKGTEDNVTNPGQSDQHTSLTSKVDTSLFDVEEGEEESVKILKLTPKDDKVTKVNYDNKQIWSGSKTFGTSSNLVDALVYFDEETPAFVTIQTIKGGKESTVYRYRDGKQWKDSKEEEHKKLLDALKEKYKLGDPVTLDLSNPDETKLDVHTENESEVSFKEYTPKNCYHISSVMNADNELWRATEGTNEKCLLAECYEKGDITILYLETDDGNNNQSKYFWKVGTEWKSIDKKEFNDKGEVMIGESGRDASLNIAHPNRLLHKSFNYYYDDNLIQLIVPKKNVSVSKLMNSLENVYTRSSGETLDHVKVYLNKEGKAELVIVVSNFSSDIKYNYFAKNGTKWECTLDYFEKLKSLKVVSSSKTDISIDLEREEDTDECRVVNVEPLYVPTRFHLPKPGYLVKEVTNGEDAIWTATGEERCTSCAIYSKNDVHLLALFIKDGENYDHKHFEKNGSNWKEISKDELDNQYKNMKDAAVRSS
ncbi:signal peptide-containing protein [Theileria equi strain WA]|uniref:Signal peptide-containing protein n=1 Tax=Theileria equi strain WA TaxID=1537102 RepID=L0B102_THEEQ|nr:signal peptide-containing protein [Theileria equi strain WA]AFZ80814.1 signal peptide-containing protein [Theileria equi strain WA]|eukprot:XP_004830480.1 signal peptide-containing protein [Theileria equi strain WA]